MNPEWFMDYPHLFRSKTTLDNQFGKLRIGCEQLGVNPFLHIAA